MTPLAGWGQGPSVYVADLSCVGGPWGLHLPKTLPELLKLGRIERKTQGEVERWEGYTTTLESIAMPGLVLHYISFSNDPQRYLLSGAEITHRRWATLAPFQVGESVGAARRRLGALAAKDPGLQAPYSSDGDSVQFESKAGKVTRIVYACYTG